MPPDASRRIRRGLLWAAALVYLTIALRSIDVDVARLVEGVPRSASWAAALLHPDFSSRWIDVRDGLLESLAISVLSTAAGAILALPLGLGAARNLATPGVYLACRSIVAGARGFHEIVLAIFFVVVVGLGPLAGVLTLAVGSVGFLAKLLAEAIESIDPAPLDAVRATGATWAQRVAFGVVPQVAPRMVGLAVYRLDINLRESTVIGVVGAGGIGATLQTAFGRYDWRSASAILVLLVGIVLVLELAAGRLRRSLV